jgi:hypothetical protein
VAIVTGYVLMVLLGMAAGTLLSLVAPATFPPDGQGSAPLPGLGWYALTLAYSVVFAILGGHTCARLARRDEMMHAGVLAALLAVAGLRLLLTAPSPIPMWRSAGYLAASVTGVLVGGLIRARAR